MNQDIREKVENILSGDVILRVYYLVALIQEERAEAVREFAEKVNRPWRVLTGSIPDIKEKQEISELLATYQDKEER